MLVVACGDTDPAYKGRSAESWAAQLRSSSAEARISAADAMYHIAPRSEYAVTALLNAMRDSNPEVQAAVAVALATIGPRALPGLTDAIADDHARVRELAIGLLASQGAASISALPQITTALADSDDGVRRAAAVAISRFGVQARDAGPALAKAAGTGTPEFRAACLLALVATHSDTAAARAVGIAALHDAAAVVRRAAVQVVMLTTSDGIRRFDLLVPLMRDPDTSVRLETYRAMHTLIANEAAGATAHAALLLARSDPDSSARILVRDLLSPNSRRPGEEQFRTHDAGVILRGPP